MEKKKSYKRVNSSDMDIIGNPGAIKVVDKQIEPALQKWKKNQKDSGIMDVYKNNRYYEKPSATKRKQRQEAIRRNKLT